MTSIQASKIKKVRRIYLNILSALKRICWWLTPLGRVRLVLADAQNTSNLTRTRAHLKKKLKILRQPRYATHPVKDELMPLVLAKLVELALHQSELHEATNFLEQLDRVDTVAEVRLGLRWELIQALIQRHYMEEVLNQGKLYVGDACSPPDKVGELLIWSLTAAEREIAQQIAKSVGSHLQFHHRIETLRMLCLETEAVNPGCERICKDLLGIIITNPDYPNHLLRAACSVVLGHGDELAKALQNSKKKSASFSEEQQFFQILLQVFTYLRNGEEVSNVNYLIEGLKYNAGSLVKSMPLLANISILLQNLLLATIGEEVQITKKLLFNLSDSAWAQWICLRLWITQAPIPEVAEVLTSKQIADCHPALVWEGIAWMQDFSAMILPSPLSIITERLTSFTENSQLSDGLIWQDLGRLRRDLTTLASSIAEQESYKSGLAIHQTSSPWWSEDGPLQPLTQKEGQIELFYLNGRHALRHKSPAEALKWFNSARDLCGENKITNFLTYLRFVPILNYWQGVTLAHLEQWYEAKEKLQLCLEDPKKIESLVQLGLIALAEDNLEMADEYLKQIPNSKTPVSALYLAALIAERKGEKDVMQCKLTQVKEIDSAKTSIYSVATYRLRGALEEREGNYDAAAEKYRQVLSSWSVDSVAASRLANVWLRESYHKVLNGQIFPSLRDYLLVILGIVDCPKNNLILPVDLIKSQGGNVLKRLALYSFLTLGEVETARQCLQTWLAEDEANLHLKKIEVIFNLDRELKIFCSNTGEVSQNVKNSPAKLEELIIHIATLRTQLPSEPVVRFWDYLARVFLNPNLLESEELFTSILFDEKLPEAQRSLVAVINLFSGNIEQRQQAATLCQQFLETGVFGDEKIKKAIACLVAYVNGSDQEFLEHYKKVESDLSVLPCGETELYVAACEARLRVGAIDEVTEGFIPDSLAELEHPDVRRVIGLAYAQRAVCNAEKDVRAALQDLEQATQLLDLPDV